MMTRLFFFAAPLWMLSVAPGKAQFVTVAPAQITFQPAAYTLIPPEQPPTELIGFTPNPFGQDKVPFALKSITPVNLPSGPPTDFVIVSPTAGVARAISSVSLNPKVVPYMRPGIYELLVLFHNPERPEFGTSGVRVRLRLDVPGIPEIASVVNAASMRPGISPGELVTIRGTHLSSPPVTGEPDSAGLFPRSISNTRVTFNGIAAPLLYVSTGQINCVVPHGVAGSKTAQVIVALTAEASSLPSPAVTVPVSATSPGIFTADQSGSGPGLILNTGAGTGWNAESNPAPKGTSITLYATGAGAWNVPYPDGSLVITPLVVLPPSPSPAALVPVGEVSVTIGGQPAKVVAAKAQGMRVSGMLEVTAEIPEGAGSGAQAVVLKVGENDNADQNVSVWVR